MPSEKIFAICLLIASILTSLYLFQNYIGSFIIASVLTVATYPLFNILHVKCRSKALSAIGVLVLMMLLVFVPVSYIVTTSLSINIDIALIQTKLAELIAFVTKLLERFPLVQDRLKEIISSLDIASMSRNIFSYIGLITAKSAGFVKDAIFIIMFYFVLLIYGKDITSFVLKTLPFSSQNAQRLIDDGSVTIKSLFYSLFLMAFIEGALFALIVFFYDLDALYLGIFYGIASMIPIVGGALVWIPVSVFVGLNVSINAGLIVALFSILVIGTLVDNFTRPMIVNWINKKLLKSDKSLNEILIFFSMLAGLGMFGFFGIILGPTIVAVTISLMKLFQKDEK